MLYFTPLDAAENLRLLSAAHVVLDPYPVRYPCVYVCEDEEGGYRKDVIALCVDPTSSY